MPIGDSGFTAQQRRDIDRAIRSAETECRFEISVYVGPTEDDHRDYAERMHAVLSSPDRSIVVMVDPNARALEIVTGAEVRRALSDDAVKLATVAMQSAFAEGDLVGGIKRGVTMLGEAARQPETLHTDEP